MLFSKVRQEIIGIVELNTFKKALKSRLLEACYYNLSDLSNCLFFLTSAIESFKIIHSLHYEHYHTISITPDWTTSSTSALSDKKNQSDGSQASWVYGTETGDVDVIRRV